MVNPLPIAITTDEKRFLMESAVLMRDSGRLDQAAVMFEAIVSLVDDRHLPLIGLGSVEFERGAFERAVERFERKKDKPPGELQSVRWRSLDTQQPAGGLNVRSRVS